tara:strand:- start:92 stop:1156 length:1065 start_codon:yes stop_codon:yes gene_type:complete
MRINFSHPLKKKFLKVIKNLNKELKSLKKTRLNYNFLINELIYLNLKVENILFNKSLNQPNPISLVKKDLNFLLERIVNIKTFDDYDKKIPIKFTPFKREKSHKNLFQKLWVNYNYEKFKRERLGRYNKRITINKLKKLIKNKRIVDFGCGHGNFLLSCLYNGAIKCDGVDYGINSINYAKKISKKLKFKNKINFYCRPIYNTKLKSNYYDFAIQNGVFHHVDNEIKAYKEMHRVLKKNGYCWIYTDGGGGIRDFVWDLSQNILKDINKDLVINSIFSYGLTTNKEYHLGDGLNALYRHTSLDTMKKKLSKIGFKFIRQLNGGFKTDYDKPFYKDKYFNIKFGSGDLRLLFEKK